MFGPFLASVAFGFIKGLTSSSEEREEPFSLEQDFMGPVKEELIYRGTPLWLKPNLPFGSTAAIFAADHLVSDHRMAVLEGTPTPSASQIVARLGDTFAGGLMYEMAFRRHGILGAIAAHVGHNWAVGLGAKARRR